MLELALFTKSCCSQCIIVLYAHSHAALSLKAEQDVWFPLELLIGGLIILPLLNYMCYKFVLSFYGLKPFYSCLGLNLTNFKTQNRQFDSHFRGYCLNALKSYSPFRIKKLSF